MRTVFGSAAGMLLRGYEDIGSVFVLLGCCTLAVAFRIDDKLRYSTGTFAWDQPLTGLLPKRDGLIMLAATPIGLIMSLQIFLVGSPFRALTMAGTALSLLLAGVAICVGSEALVTVATILFGVSTIGSGAGFLSVAVMFGTMGLIIGSATAALGIGRMRPTLTQVRRKLIEMSAEPGEGDGSATRCSRA